MITYNFNLLNAKNGLARVEYQAKDIELTTLEVMEIVVKEHQPSHIQLHSVVVD